MLHRRSAEHQLFLLVNNCRDAIDGRCGLGVVVNSDDVVRDRAKPRPVLSTTRRLRDRKPLQPDAHFATTNLSVCPERQATAARAAYLAQVCASCAGSGVECLLTRLLTGGAKTSEPHRRALSIFAV